MVKKEIKSEYKSIAVLLIALIITLPIYSADALAATNGLSNVKVRGKDTIDGYVRNNADYFTFTARAFIQDVTINNTKVRLLGSSATTGFPFDSCIPVGDGSFDCAFSRNMTDLSVCPKFTFTVNLYNVSNNLFDAKQVVATCDNLAPIITLSTDKNVYAANQNVTFTVNIVDKAQGSSSATECSGIQNFVTLTSDKYSKNFQIFPSGCSVTTDIKELSNAFAEGSPSITLTAFDNFGQQGQQSITVTTDFTSPSIELRDFDIRNLDGSFVNFFVPEVYKAQLTFEVSDKDLAFDTFSIDLSTLNIKGGSTTPVCSQLNSTTQRCSLSNVQIQVDTASFANTIVASANDNAGNKRTRLINLNKVFTPDNTAPRFENLTLFKLDGSSVTGVSSSALSGITLNVDIIESEIGLDTNSITANLNALNPKLNVYGNVAKSSCITINSNKTRCSWTGLIMDLGAPPNITLRVPLVFTFKARDKAGNNASEPLTYNVFIDTQGPVVAEIGTDKTDSNGTYYVGAKKNIFGVILIETGSGIDPKDVFLDLSALGGSPNLPADNCTGTGQVICIWNNVDISAGSGKKYIGLSSLTKDKAGNYLAGYAGTTIVVLDTTSPAVNFVNVTAVAGSTSVLSGFILTGNALSIVAEVQEDNNLNAFVDASAFIKNAIKINADSCSKISNNIQRCTWATDEINIKGFISAGLIFNFTDSAGNSIKHIKNITVTGVGNKTIDFWKNSVGSPSPNAIDKQLITKYDPFIWFPVALSTDTTLPSKKWPVTVTLDRCSENESVIISSATGNKPELFNFNPTSPKADSTLPYNVFFKFTLERALPPQDSMKIQCGIKIRTLVDNKEISLEENENITFTINYFNNPLGTIDSRIDKEIKDVKESWLVQAKWLETAQKIFNFAQTACTIVRHVIIAWGIVTGIVDGFKGCCQGSAVANVISAPICCSTAAALGTKVTFGAQLAKTGWAARTNQFCKALNCQFFWGDWLPDSVKVGPLEKYSEMVSKSSVVQGTKKVAGQEVPYERKDRNWYLGNIDPKQSLIGSAVFLCLPGVIYNLQKARAIDCRYINCLKQTQNGMPLYLCTAQRQYAYCKYVWGQIFNLIPFAAALTQIGQSITKALSHPLEAVSTSLSVACYIAKCANAVSPGFCQVCYAADTLSWFTDVLCDLGIGSARCEPIWEKLAIDTDNACKEALKEEDKEKGSTGSPTFGY